jgi:hypothetical protein
MTENFKRFFDAVSQVADACGIEAFAVAGVFRGQTPGQVTVASNACSKLESSDPTFTERYCEAMADSLDMALARLADGDDDGDKPDFLN